MTDDDLNHAIERQLKPYLRGRELIEDGTYARGEAAFANVAPGAEGVTITCTGCGASGTVPPEVAERAARAPVVLCPTCILKA